MSHLDEGTLHALLDGELDSHEVAEIQAHLGACSSCGLRLREVKEFLSEADRLIASVNLDATATPPLPRLTPMPAAPVAAGAGAPRAEPEPSEAPARPQPPAQPAKWEPWNEPPPPVLLIPENESAAEKRMRRMRRLGWAAIVLVIAGAGWVEARKMMPVGPLPADSAAPKIAAVVSPQETERTDSLSPAASVATNAASRGDSTPAPTAVAARKPAPPKPSATGAVRASKAARPAPAAEDTEPTPLVPRDETAAGSAAIQSADSGVNADSAQPAEQADTSETAAPGAEDLTTVRARASQALADLDRERRVKQAAAATAALDAQKRRPQPAPAARAAPPAAPAPVTLEQRARIYLRIGLDEASRQLGGPTHVIEGLSPLFMGLVQGTSVAGADAGRPVVRVVYQDSQGRLILLDQQRLRSGQTPPPTTALSWTIGSTAVWLSGEAPTDALRTYRARVR